MSRNFLRLRFFYELITILYLLLRISFLKKFGSFSNIVSYIKKFRLLKKESKEMNIAFYIRLIKKIAKLFSIKSCLVITTVSKIFFLINGVNVNMKIGIKFNDSKTFRSHSWINYRDIDYDDEEHIKKFKVMASY